MVSISPNAEKTRDVAHDQHVGGGLGRNDVIAAVAGAERPVTPLVQAGGRNNGDAPRREWLCSVVVGRAFDTPEVLGLVLGMSLRRLTIASPSPAAVYSVAS